MLVLVVALASAVVASAQESLGLTEPHKFDIPSQSLVDALQTYSVQAGVQVMFETSSAVGYCAAAVQGEFMPEAALRMLLANTDLKIRYSRASAITLAPASAPDPDAPPVQGWAAANVVTDMALETLRVSGAGEQIDQNQLGKYIGVVQSDIQKALKKVKTRQGDYRVGIRLWVDPSRVVQRAELEGTTGDRDRDGAIAETLHGLVLSQQAPANTPQPVRFLIRIHTL